MSESAPASTAAPPPRKHRIAWTPLRLLAVCVVALVVALIAMVAFVVTYDWNRARPWISERISQSLQRPFAINGDLDVRWLRVQQPDGSRSSLPWPHVFAHSVVLGNPQWAEHAEMAKVDELAFVVSPLPLLGNRLHVPALRLTGTTIAFERLADGRNNWTFGRSGAAPAWSMQLGDLVFEEGRILVEDAIQRASIVLEARPLVVPAGFDEILKTEEDAVRAASAQTIGENAARKFRDAAAATDRTRKRERRATRAYEFAWTAQGTFRGVEVEGNGRSGGILALGSEQEPFPLQARLRAGSTRIAFVGTLTNPSDLAALDLRLWLSGKSMGNLFPLTGVNLPESPPYATEGHLTGDLSGVANVFRYEEFTGRVGGSDLGGSLTYAEGEPRGKLSGAVQSRLLQFSDLGPMVGAANAAPAAESASRIFPTATFRTDRWNAMDADVAFSGERVLHAKEWPVDKVETRILLDNGKLRLDPLDFGFAGGRIDSAIRLDGTRKPLHGQVELTARGLELEQLLPGISTADASFGEINGAATLAGTGNSIAGLFGSSDGELKLLINDGEISKVLLETAGLNIGNIILARLFGDSNVKINCAASQFSVGGGVMTTEAFLIDTEDALIEISGSIDIGNEQYDMTVRPQSKGLRIFSLRSPLHIKGSLRNPEVGVDKGPLIARGAGAVLLGVFAAPAAALLPLIATSKRDDPNRCEDLLAAMRGQGKPVVPTGTPAKSANLAKTAAKPR